MKTPAICSGCGKCCSTERFELFDEEYERIKPYLKHPLTEKKGFLWIFATGKDPCPALDTDGCRIPYKKRPAVCRMFPYVLEKIYIQNKAFDISLSRKCLHYRLFSLIPENETEILTIALELADLQASQAITTLLAKGISQDEIINDVTLLAANVFTKEITRDEIANTVKELVGARS
ncbi:MAG: YkgJ family cysteine cluster protein [Methanoregula sp.]|jgi:Fe-S-cluster containining protein